eukprot:tig00020684_g12848.t1
MYSTHYTYALPPLLRPRYYSARLIHGLSANASTLVAALEDPELTKIGGTRYLEFGIDLECGYPGAERGARRRGSSGARRQQLVRGGLGMSRSS